MREILLWWKSKSKETKKSIMKEHNIKSITFEEIKSLYLERV